MSMGNHAMVSKNERAKEKEENRKIKQKGHQYAVSKEQITNYKKIVWWRKVAQLMPHGYTPQYRTCLAAATGCRPA